MTNYIHIDLFDNCTKNNVTGFNVTIIEALDSSLNIIDSNGYVPNKGDKIYLMPGVNIPRVKLKDLTLNLGIKVVRSPEDATVVFAGRSTGGKITSSKWYYFINAEYALNKLKVICSDQDYIDRLELAINSTNVTRIAMEYHHANIIIDGDPWSDHEKDSNYIYHIENDYLDDYKALEGKSIYDESELLNQINGDDATIIDETVFLQLHNMFDSSDEDNHTLAMEIMANCNYQESIMYLLILLDKNNYQINNSRSRNHVNFKAMLSYFNMVPRDIGRSDSSTIIKKIDSKELLTVDMIRRIYKEYEDDICRSIHYDKIFKIKQVTLNEEYLAKFNINYIEDLVPDFKTDDSQDSPGPQVEEEELDDELIEAALTNINRKELKSELIALENENLDITGELKEIMQLIDKIIPDELLQAVLTDIETNDFEIELTATEESNPVSESELNKPEVESNNNQIEETNGGNDLDWF
jgi:hypothetical protein